MPRKFVRQFLDDRFGNPWERWLRSARRRDLSRVLIFWNRGLGDVALGLHQIILDLRATLPRVEITVFTRPELAECFRLLAVDHVMTDPAMERSEGTSTLRLNQHVAAHPDTYDAVLARIDPSRWLRKRAREQPRLRWSTAFDSLVGRFDDRFVDVTPDAICIALHVKSETAAFYRYEKDWPVASWCALADELAASRPCRFVLFGLSADEPFDIPGAIDLRGRTTLLEMLAVIRNRCRILIAPDSGVLTMVYYLDVQTPIGVVSLWSDPRQGILKQGVASPNVSLRHVALIGLDEKVARIPVSEVSAAVDSLLAGMR